MTTSLWLLLVRTFKLRTSVCRIEVTTLAHLKWKTHQLHIIGLDSLYSVLRLLDYMLDLDIGGNGTRRIHVGALTILFTTDNLLQVNQEALAKLSEVMKYNKSVESLFVYLGEGLLGERHQVFATMATSGGWSSIKELILDLTVTSAMMMMMSMASNLCL